MKKRQTLADLAAAAGVSLMTVSRAINNKPGVSDELRQKIIDLAAELGYRPNQIARSLATNFTTAIGLVVPDNTNPFFAQIARGVEDAAFENGYNIYLLNTNEEPVRELAALDSLWQKNIDGVILCSSRLSEDLLKEEIKRFPAMVLLNRELQDPQPNVITVNVNDQRGATLAIHYFLNKFRKNIAYIGGPETSYSHHRRLEAYRTGLKASDLLLDPQMIECNQPNTGGGRIAMAELLKRRPDLDSVLCFNDLMAVGAVQICQEAGKKVPEEIAVIGVDDIPLATIFRPQLTTLHVNLQQIGHLALRTLLDIVAGDSSPASIQIEPVLQVRESA